jgi:hypothetical protein
MGEGSEVLTVDLSIRKRPEAVRAWWVDLPDDYQAKDPKEQPYRIVTLRRLPNGRELRTYWRMPDGSTRDWQEILTLKPNGDWTFEIPSHPTGLHILDEFQPETTPEGTRLHIRSTLTPREPSAASRIAMQKERMSQAWKVAAEICERDAP